VRPSPYSPAPPASSVTQGCSTTPSTTPPRSSTTPTITRCCSTRSPCGRSTSAGSLHRARPHGSSTRRDRHPRAHSTAPQWKIIERITNAGVLARAGQHEYAAAALKEAVTNAEHRHLPHQIQRVIRVTTRSQVPAVQASTSLPAKHSPAYRHGSTPAAPARRALLASPPDAE
jgi:hypothetical protein